MYTFTNVGAEEFRRLVSSLCTVIRIAYSPGLRAWHYLLVATASFVLEPQVMNLSHHYSKAPSVANLDTELERPLFLHLNFGSYIVVL